VASSRQSSGRPRASTQAVVRKQPSLFSVLLALIPITPLSTFAANASHSLGGRKTDSALGARARSSTGTPRRRSVVGSRGVGVFSFFAGGWPTPSFRTSSTVPMLLPLSVASPAAMARITGSSSPERMATSVCSQVRSTSEPTTRGWPPSRPVSFSRMPTTSFRLASRNFCSAFDSACALTWCRPARERMGEKFLNRLVPYP
jgi:hypothetical protein